MAAPPSAAPVPVRGAPDAVARPARHGGKAASLTEPAKRSYNLAEEWDRTAGLSEEEAEAVEALSLSCTQRPYPEHVLGAQASPTHRRTASQTSALSPAAAEDEGTRGQHQAPASWGSLEEVVLQNAHQFYLWHGELEAARTLETEEKYRQYGEVLGGHLGTCGQLLGQVDETLGFFEGLQEQHKDVQRKTKTIHDSCERLVEEKERLAEFADALRAKLSFFDELETISAHFHSASLSVEGSHFLPMLKRLDECITFVSSNPQYADSASYQGKFRQLQSRALGTIRSRVKAVLDKAAAQVLKGVAGAGAGAFAAPADAAAGGVNPEKAEDLSASLSEGAETALLYVRFRAAAESSLKGLLTEIEARNSRVEYAKLLTELQTLFCETRLMLVGHVVEQRINQLSGLPIPALTRNGCAYLMQVCQLEAQLFEHFFPAAAAEPEAMKPLLEPMCNILYDALRPTCIMISDVDQLCELVEIMRHEVLQEQLGRRGNAIAPLRPTIQRVLQDVQERLTFRVQAYLKDSVASYVPNDSDTDFPGRLEAAASSKATDDGKETNGHNGTAAGPNQIPEVLEAQVEAGGAPADVNQSSLTSMDSYSLWFPPLQRALLLLSKVYRCLPKSIFGGIAHEAVASTTTSVKQASQLVARRSGPMDGQLYMIKHLLILREQIAPFEAEFAVAEKDLDFGHMRDQLRRIMVGESSLFSMSSSNAVFQFMGSGVRVMENTVDSKKDLEKLLKVTCEAFIMAVTKLTVEPMLSFITKVTAVKVSSAASKPLKEQAFASPAKLGEMLAKVNQALENALPKAVEKMKMYLNNPSTHAILFKPIKSNIAEAHGQIAALLESEYSEAEADSCGLKPPDQLSALLDGLS